MCKVSKLEDYSFLNVLSNQLSNSNMYSENTDQVDNNFRKFRREANKSEPVGRLSVVYKKSLFIPVPVPIYLPSSLLFGKKIRLQKD